MKSISSVILLFAVASPVTVWAVGSDELWEVTTKMEMPGMHMPAMTQTLCLAKGAGYKPGKVPHQRHCKVTELEVSGNKTSWNVHCSGRNQMKGSGQVLRSGKTMKGSMRLSSESIQMTQTISGNRIGTCRAK